MARLTSCCDRFLMLILTYCNECYDSAMEKVTATTLQILSISSHGQ
jgi:hypothetical protein